MLLLLQGLIPKKPDEEEGKGEDEEEDEEIEDDGTNSSEEGDGVEGMENHYLKPDNLLYNTFH